MAISLTSNNARIDTAGWITSYPSLSIMGWVRIDVDKDGAHFFVKEEEINIFFNGSFSGNTMRLQYERASDGGATGCWVTDVDSIKQGELYHLAIVHDATVFAASVAKLFINGVENTNVVTAPTGLRNTDNNVYKIGGLNPTLPLGGLLADFRMYTRAFTDDEIAIVYGSEGGDEMHLEDLLVRVPLDDRAPGVVGTTPAPIDLSPFARPLTFGGGTIAGVADVFGLSHRKRLPRKLRA